ncbi:MAG: DUF4173 domain-containing protein [Bacillaceae bacterium]|nr:DUF4173 domain-containing protein [Bacillaceae bacterium]
MSKRDWMTLGMAFILGIGAEISFFHGEIGLSFPVFITLFYVGFFWIFRKHHFTNLKLGLLFTASIWLLSVTYLFYSNPFFYVFNLLVIPGLMFLQLIIITSPASWPWDRLPYLQAAFSRIGESAKSIIHLFSSLVDLALKGLDQGKRNILKKILLGLLIASPIVVVVLFLLMMADPEFSRLVIKLPEWFFSFVRLEMIIRMVIVMIFSLGFYGGFRALHKKWEPNPGPGSKGILHLDGIMIITVLVLLNIIYGLFVLVQFQYFFSGQLYGDFTYAEYARRGFFELVMVTLINWSVLVAVLNFGRKMAPRLKRAIQVMLTLMIAFSGVMLTSAYMRLLMYEAAYGYTLDRVLAHAFMIFLGAIFLYTLIRVWIEHLSLMRFYMIFSILFYTALNVVNVNGLIVEKNLERYEQTGKIDVSYLYQLSYSGLMGLMDLYEMNPQMTGLENILADRKKMMIHDSRSWQSFNLERKKAYERLMEMELE